MPYAHVCPSHGPEPCPNLPNQPDGHACANDSKVNERTTGEKWLAFRTPFPLVVG